MTREKKGYGRIGDDRGKETCGAAKQSYLPSIIWIPSPPLFSTSRCMILGAHGPPDNLVLFIGINTVSLCSVPWQSIWWGFSQHYQVWGYLMCTKRNGLRDENQETLICCLLTSILRLHPHSSCHMQGRIFFLAKAVSWQVGGSHFSLQSFLWICTAVLKFLGAKWKGFLSPSFPWCSAPKDWGLVVQMTGWCHLWTEVLHHQWFPR